MASTINRSSASRSSPLALAPVDQRQLILAHRALSGLDHAVRFAPNDVAVSFNAFVRLLDGCGAVQLDGEPVWLQSVIDSPGQSGVSLALTYADLAEQLLALDEATPVTQSTALHIAGRLSQPTAKQAVTLRRDKQSNEALQHGLAHWEHVVSDEAGDADGLVMAAIADAKFRRLSPFTSNNHSCAGLLLAAVLKEEQILQSASLNVSFYFSKHSQDFYRALTDDDTVVRFYLRMFTDTALELIDQLERLAVHVAHCRDVVEDTLPRAPVASVMQAIVKPICTNADLMEAGVTRRQTSASYLKKLAQVGLLQSHQKGKELRYVNPGVLAAFADSE